MAMLPLHALGILHSIDNTEHLYLFIIKIVQKSADENSKFGLYFSILLSFIYFWRFHCIDVIITIIIKTSTTFSDSGVTMAYGALSNILAYYKYFVPEASRSSYQKVPVCHASSGTCPTTGNNCIYLVVSWFSTAAAKC